MFMALCMSWGAILPLSSDYVQAQENVAEKEQTGIVSLTQNKINILSGMSILLVRLV